MIKWRNIITRINHLPVMDKKCIFEGISAGVINEIKSEQ